MEPRAAHQRSYSQIDYEGFTTNNLIDMRSKEADLLINLWADWIFAIQPSLCWIYFSISLSGVSWKNKYRLVCHALRLFIVFFKAVSPWNTSKLKYHKCHSRFRKRREWKFMEYIKEISHKFSMFEYIYNIKLTVTNLFLLLLHLLSLSCTDYCIVNLSATPSGLSRCLLEKLRVAFQISVESIRDNIIGTR